MPTPSPSGPVRWRDAAGASAAPADSVLMDAVHQSVIADSHSRCQALGVSRIDTPDLAHVARAELSIALERNRRLHDHAAPVMALLHEQIVNSESMVVLTDATGTVIHAVGDDDFLGRANKVALRTGANWSESSKGTNAIGTALVSEVPTLVHADEHYLHANHFLTCSAAPILDPRGNILGVLDVSGEQRSYHRHTLALVRMSARMIENRWLSEDFGHALRLHFHTRAEFIGTLMEGVLAIAADGRIVGANRGALEQLGMSGAALRMHNVATLFDTSLPALMDHFRSALATPLPLITTGGRTYTGVARFNWPMWATVTLGQVAAGQGAASPAPMPTPAVAADSALAQLQTGDPQVDALVQKVRRVLNRDIPILILGETGTGKELLARAIHEDSARGKQPFVAVNCASIPEALIEAELFGYEEGAFTGARRKGQVGKILQAHGGTLFLDEIGDMPLPLQAHLLRVLQERQVTPLGSTRSVAVDVALICATHRNLREMIGAQTFREDLYYRLNGLAVRLPPLRERRDMPTLVERLLERQGRNSGAQRRLQIASEVRELFDCYGWPGNVRQLASVMGTASVMAEGAGMIRREHLPDDFLEEVAALVRAAPPAAPVQPPLPMAPQSEAATPAAPFSSQLPAGTEVAAAAEIAETAARTLEDMEVDLIRRTLEAVNGNISEASKRLGISRNTIYRKLRWRNDSSRSSA